MKRLSLANVTTRTTTAKLEPATLLALGVLNHLRCQVRAQDDLSGDEQ
jgi:hypothetical protein